MDVSPLKKTTYAVCICCRRKYKHDSQTPGEIIAASTNYCSRKVKEWKPPLLTTFFVLIRYYTTLRLSCQGKSPKKTCNTPKLGHLGAESNPALIGTNQRQSLSRSGYLSLRSPRPQWFIKKSAKSVKSAVAKSFFLCIIMNMNESHTARSFFKAVLGSFGFAQDRLNILLLRR